MKLKPCHICDTNVASMAACWQCSKSDGWPAFYPGKSRAKNVEGPIMQITLEDFEVDRDEKIVWVRKGVKP